MAGLIRSSKAACFIGVLVFITSSCFYYLLSTRHRVDRSLSNQLSPVFFSYAQNDTVHPKESGAWPYHVYKSSPLTPPVLEITDNGEVAEGSIFLVPGHANDVWIAQEQPYIMSQDNDLVFGFETPSGFIDSGRFNGLFPHSVNGKSFASMWLGSSEIGHGYGNIVVLDDQYQQSTIVLEQPIVANTNAPHIGVLDFHEHQMTDRGTILVTAYNVTKQDLTILGGRKDGWVTDSLFFEIDIKTNEVVFSWSALDHFRFTDSKLPLPCYMSDGSKQLGYDFFHINSVQAVGENFLISSRHQWACYLISRSGEILWGIDGSGEDERFDWPAPEAQFRWQHHARAHNVSNTGFTLSLFDNHNALFDMGSKPSGALLFNITLFPEVKTPPVLLRNLQPPQDIYSDKEGSFFADLPNSHSLVSYGIPVAYEFGPSGESSDIRSKIRFANDKGAHTYRVSKAVWKATPKDWSPSLVLEKGHDGLNMYVSWNGATEVESWNIYSVGPAGALSQIGRAMASGFETVIEIPEDFSDVDCAIVTAVQNGREERWSDIACWADWRRS